jgi:hypothetical protein
MNVQQLNDSRMSIRVFVRINATIEFPPRVDTVSVRGVTRDLGLGGVFVELTGVSVKQGALARLTLEAAPSDPLIIDAMVLHSDEQGAVLMFGDYDDDVFSRLAALMQPELEKQYCTSDRHRRGDRQVAKDMRIFRSIDRAVTANAFR